MRWIKASERLPDKGKPVFARVGGFLIGVIITSVIDGKLHEASTLEPLQYDYHNIEWLDESPITTPLTEFIEKEAEKRFLTMIGEDTFAKKSRILGAYLKSEFVAGATLMLPIIEEKDKQMDIVKEQLDGAIEDYNDTLKKLEEKEREIANLKTVMIAAAEEIKEHWEAHCDKEGYGPSSLLRRLEQGIPVEYGYTAGNFKSLQEQIQSLTEERDKWKELAEAAEKALNSILKSNSIYANYDLFHKYQQLKNKSI